MSTISHQRQRIPKGPQCDGIHKHSLSLTADDWAKLKFTLLKNCLTDECEQSVGALDTLFSTIDDGLKEIP